MPRLLIFGAVLLVGIILGCFGGYMYAYFSLDSSNRKWSERDDAFLHKLEAIEGTISCEDLNKVGLSEPRKKDDVTYYVNVRDKDYQVIGFATDSLGPLISWTGAGRQPCKETSPSNPALKRGAPQTPPSCLNIGPHDLASIPTRSLF